MPRRGALALALLALSASVLAERPATTFEEDLDCPTDVAWTHVMGTPPGTPPPPRPRAPDPFSGGDDGAHAGAPIGGIGAGSIGRTYRGDFARWHLRLGRRVHHPAPHTFFAAGIDFFGTGEPSEPTELQRFEPPCIGDGLIEVVATMSAWHLGAIRLGFGHSHRVAQGASVEVILREALPVQVDGEPWLQPL